MMALDRTGQPRSVHTGGLTEAEFQRIAAVAQEDYGIHLMPQKKSMVEARIGKRIRALGLDGFEAYCSLLEPPDSPERRSFVSAITTNVTHFYRELHHFQFLESNVLPDLLARARSGGRVRLWSAGCSSGPEPYSLAASILHLCRDAARHDLRILATDLDEQVLDLARSGDYDAEVCDTPGPDWDARLFEPAAGDGRRRVRGPLRDLVTFQPLNLNGPWPMSGKFDVIMCRNVAIYFDNGVQQRLWSRFLDLLVPGGVLIIGHSERLTGPAAASFKPCAITSYRKTG